MFDSKLKELFPVAPAPKSPTSGKKSAFVERSKKKAAETRSGNDALKYSTTGNVFVDQFGKFGSYKEQREYSDVARDCELLWAEDRQKCVRMIFYIRLISRIPQMHNPKERSIKKTQRGAELRHEAFMRMIWLSQKVPDLFDEHIELLTIVGSWKDIIQLLQYDLMYNGWENRKLNWNRMNRLLLSGLENKHTSNLVKKFIPSIRSRKQCRTLQAQADNLIAKWLCTSLFWKNEKLSQILDAVGSADSAIARAKMYKQYRKLKSSGTAHQWQQLISQGKMHRIDFSKVHGRALSLMVKSKFLKNQKLTEKYQAWITKPETKAKYTGFVHELFGDLFRKYKTLSAIPVYEQETINKQFATLVEKGKSENHTTSLIVVRDTSGSMGAFANGTTIRCYDIAKALAIYFSEFLKGKFSDAWIEFNTNAKMHEWEGKTPLEKWYNDTSSCIGNTNFLSVIELFCSVKNSGVPEEEFPTGILCISDGEFDPGQLGKANIESALVMLRNAGFSQDYVSNFIIVLWNLQSYYYGKGTGEKFETFGTVNNVYYFSGYSASVISFLSSRIKNAEELVEEALNQEIFDTIVVE